MSEAENRCQVGRNAAAALICIECFWPQAFPCRSACAHTRVHNEVRSDAGAVTLRIQTKMDDIIADQPPELADLAQKGITHRASKSVFLALLSLLSAAV